MASYNTIQHLAHNLRSTFRDPPAPSRCINPLACGIFTLWPSTHTQSCSLPGYLEPRQHRHIQLKHTCTDSAHLHKKIVLLQLMPLMQLVLLPVSNGRSAWSCIEYRPLHGCSCRTCLGAMLDTNITNTFKKNQNLLQPTCLVHCTTNQNDKV